MKTNEFNNWWLKIDKKWLIIDISNKFYTFKQMD